MGSLRANWHLDIEGLDDSDPLQAVDITTMATPIDLSKPKAELHADLTRLLKRENDFAVRAHLECEVKWANGGRCPFGCPHYTEDAEHEARALLCALGREQEGILTALQATRAPVSEFEELADALL